MIKAIVKFVEYDKKTGEEQVVAEQEVKFQHDETISFPDKKHELYPGYWVRDFRLFLDCNAAKDDGSIQRLRSSIGGIARLERLESSWENTTKSLSRSLEDIGSQFEELKSYLGTFEKRKIKRGRPKKPKTIEPVQDIDDSSPF